jgi:small subunit ribosomal protein S1
MDEKFKVGDDIEAKIIKVDRDERKIALSLREQHRDSDRQQMHEFHASQEKVDQSLGRAARKDRRQETEEEER